MSAKIPRESYIWSVKPLLLFACLVSFSLSNLAQNKTTTTISLSGQRVEFDSAARYRLTWKEDSIWRVDDYYLTEILASKMSYTDSALTEATGELVAYYTNGKRMKQGTFEKSLLVGAYQEWHDNGQLSAEGTYVLYPDSLASDTVSIENEQNADAAMKSVENGEWKYYHANGQLSAAISYLNGKALEASYFEEDGSPAASDKITDRAAYYEKGIEELYREIYSHIQRPVGRKKNITGFVKIQIRINRSGQVVDEFVHTSAGQKLDRVSMTAVKHIRDWVPALEHNRLISQFFILPFQFRK